MLFALALPPLHATAVLDDEFTWMLTAGPPTIAMLTPPVSERVDALVGFRITSGAAPAPGPKPQVHEAPTVMDLIPIIPINHVGAFC